MGKKLFRRGYGFGGGTGSGVDGPLEVIDQHERIEDGVSGIPDGEAQGNFGARFDGGAGLQPSRSRMRADKGSRIPGILEQRGAEGAWEIFPSRRLGLAHLKEAIVHTDGVVVLVEGDVGVRKPRGGAATSSLRKSH